MPSPPQTRTFSIAVGESLQSQAVSFFIYSALIDNPSTYWLSLSIGPRTVLIAPLRLGVRVRAYGAQTFTITALPTDPITGTPIVPGGSAVTLIVSDEDALDDQGTALAVSITGPVTATISGPVTVSGTITALLPAGTAFVANVQAVSPVAAPVPTVPLSGRTGVLIRNISTTATVWIGDATVTVGLVGFPLEPGAAVIIPVDETVDVFAVIAAGADFVSYLEVA